jgi:hypothetical protein
MSESLDGKVAIMVDDSLMTGSQALELAVTQMHSRFKKGASERLLKDQALKFGGMNIRRDAVRGIIVDQKDYFDTKVKAMVGNSGVPSIKQIKSVDGTLG